MNEPMTPETLVPILKREYEAANDLHEQLEILQRQAFEYYEAQPFGNEIDGRSQIVLPDVQETIDSASGAILKTFVSGDRTVEFEATSEEDEQTADDATAAMDYNFMRRQDGYRVLGDVLNDGLLKKIGVFKAACYEEEKVSRQRVTADPVQLAQVPEAEIEDPQDNGDGTVTVTLKQTRMEKRYVLEAVPTYEFRFSPRAKHEDTADYVGHARPVTRSELVEMGFEPDQVYNLPAYSESWAEEIESDKLDFGERADSEPAMQQVLLCEEYARIDFDGDGIAERVKVYRVENEILLDAETGEPSIETIDEQPFSVFCPFPRPHRLVGYSLADKVMDAQLARSYVARQLFDGMENANMPRTVVSESGSSDETLDDILNPIPGAPIRVRDIGAVTALQNNFNAGQSLQVMEWISREKEGRTGVGRASPTLEENSLNAQTATEYAGRQSQGENLQEMMARNLAEALARGFSKLYRLMRVEAEPFQIKADGKYRAVNPQEWPETVNMRVRVGLGNTSKDKQVQGLMAIAGPLQEAVAAGLSGPEHAFEWMDRTARSLDVGQGEDFMYDPADPEVQAKMQAKEQQPDPETEAKMAEIQAKQQDSAMQMQLRQQEAAARIELEREKAAANIDVQREKGALDQQLARDKAATEADLARERMFAEIELERERMAMNAAQQAQLNENRPGGDLDK